MGDSRFIAPLILNLSGMEVSGQIHATAPLFRGKGIFGSSLLGDFVDLSAGLDNVEKVNISCWCLKSKGDSSVYQPLAWSV